MAADMEPSTLRARIYKRVSTLDQAREGYSLSEQERLCRARIDVERWAYDGTYSDEGISGRRDDRPELQRMLSELHQFDRLVVLHTDRVFRNNAQFAVLLERLRDEGVELVSLRDSFDWSTAIGRFQAALSGALAELGSAQIAERVSGSARARAAKGLPPGGRRPKYGYQRRDVLPDGKRTGPYVIVLEEAAVVRRMFEESAAGRSHRQILRGLDADGVRTQQGARWTQGTVSRILRDSFYVGRVTIRGEVVTERGQHEPIVSPELWEAVQRAKEIRDTSPSKGRGRTPTKPFLFTKGRLRCGSCGGSMRSRSSIDRYTCQTRSDLGRGACSQSAVPRETVDGAVLDYFARVGLDVDATRRALSLRHEQEASHIRAALDRAEKALGTAQESLQRVRNDYKSGRLDAEDWKDLRNELDEERRAAEAQRDLLAARLRDLAAEHDAQDAEEDVLRRLAQLRHAVAGRITGADDINAVRAALDQLFSGFVLWKLTPDLVGFGQEVGLAVGDHYLEPVVRDDAFLGLNPDGWFRVRRVPLDLASEMTLTG